MYHQFNIQEFYVLPTRCIYVFCVDLRTAIFFSFNIIRLNLKQIFSPLKPSGHYIYQEFNIQQFYVLPTRCIYVFCVDLRTEIICLLIIRFQQNTLLRLYKFFIVIY